MIGTRMRVGAQWSNACILNLSRRGMLVRAQNVPPRGSYLEFRRGPQLIIARVVWSTSDRFGVLTQDAICAESLLRSPEGLERPTKQIDGEMPERRARPRGPDEKHESSRIQGRVFEFATLAAFGILASYFVGALMIDLVATPLALAEATLKLR